MAPTSPLPARLSILSHMHVLSLAKDVQLTTLSQNTDALTAKRWWSPYWAQTQGHLFKCCPHWKRQQKILRAEVRRQGKAEEVGAEGEGQPLFLPTPPPPPPSWPLRERNKETGEWISFAFSFAIPVVISLVRSITLGTVLGGGQRGACNVPPSRGLRTGTRTVCISS